MCVEANLPASVEFRVGAFFPSSKEVRKIYGNTAANYQFEFNTSACCCNCFCIQGWTSIDWTTRRGSVRECGRTRLDLVNWSIGVKCVKTLCGCMNVYAGVGPAFGGVWVKNHNSCHHNRHHERTSKGTFGVIVKSGIQYYFCHNLFADLFVDYIYQPVHFHRHINVGGLRTGLGIGVSF